MSIFDLAGRVVMDNDVRLTASSLKVLKLFLEAPSKELAGSEVSRTAGVGSGTLYPLLARFERAGWMASRWEEIDASKEGRPRRRLYKLTALGQSNAMRRLGEVQLSDGVLAWS